MRRQWQRLVIGVSLAAFLVANTHAAALFTRHPLTAHGHDAPTGFPRNTSTHPPCCRCHHSEHLSLADDASEAPDEDGPCDSSCPDCPKGPNGPKCPSPGGCALCSIVKALHITPALRLSHSLNCLETWFPDPSIIYISPFAGRLIRPPRV